MAPTVSNKGTEEYYKHRVQSQGISVVIIEDKHVVYL